MWAKTLLLAASVALCSAFAPAPAITHGSAAARPIMLTQVLDRRDGGGAARFSAREIVSMLQRRFGGEPMSSPTREVVGDQVFYIISWRFPNEVVQTLRVDADTGQVQ